MARIYSGGKAPSINGVGKPGQLLSLILRTEVYFRLKI